MRGPGARVLACRLFGPGVAVAVDDPTAPARGLHAVERRTVAAAVERRRREFAAGRRCARAALTRLGYRASAIPAGVDRVPIWPVGIVGSITHTSAWCAAAVASREVFRGLGLDAEPAEALPEALWDQVLTESEWEWIVRRPVGERGLLARLVFCAKEAAYKCQYPLTGRVLDFDQVQVRAPGPWSGEGALRVLLPGARLDGRYVRAASVLVTGVSVRARADPP